MDHTGEMDHTVELHHAASFHCGSYYELDIDGASSCPQLAGRVVAFSSFDMIILSSRILQSSCQRGELQITRGFLHQWFCFPQLVSLPGDLVELGMLYWTPPLG